jgi:transcriptional regulator with XRE-family HTH domain
LGVELRRLREGAGLTRVEVATRLYISPSKLSRIEGGRVSATLRDVGELLALYRVGGQQRENVLRLAKDARSRTSWWDAYRDLPSVRTYISYETEAVSIYTYESTVIPGLLQTREYAQVMFRTLMPALNSKEVERYVELRLARQSILTKEDPPALLVVLDEAPLHRPIGGRDAMWAQFRRLIEAASMPNVTFQVIPFGVELASMVGSFTIFDFGDPATPELVHLQHVTGEVYLSRTDEIQRYRRLFEGLRAATLSPAHSVDLLWSLARQL